MDATPNQLYIASSLNVANADPPILGHVWVLQYGEAGSVFQDIMSESALFCNYVDCTAVTGDTGVNMPFVCLLALRESGALYYTYRGPDGSWSPEPMLIEGSNGPGGFNFDVACAGETYDTIHLLGIDGQSAVPYYTSTDIKGNAQPWVNVNEENPNGPQPASGINRVACAVDSNGKLYVCVVDSNYNCWLTYRNSAGDWQGSFTDLSQQNSYFSGQYADISCACIDDDLHICGLQKDSYLVSYMVLSAEGTWQPRTSLHTTNQWLSVSCTNVNDNLNVAAVGQGYILWYAQYDTGQKEWLTPQSLASYQQFQGGTNLALCVGVSGVITSSQEETSS